MIICPICKEEIEDDSHFCDQCGEALLYCSKCGRVGVGRRCTYCGGMMVFIGEQKQTAYKSGSPVDMSAQIFKGVTSSTRGSSSLSLPGNDRSMPKLILENTSLNIRIEGVSGAIIGRNQGPYHEFFQNNRYVSGVHAQLVYNQSNGWCIVDKHSSNGTKLNQRSVQAGVSMSLKSDDTLSIANVNLKVRIEN